MLLETILNLDHQLVQPGVVSLQTLQLFRTQLLVQLGQLTSPLLPKQTFLSESLDQVLALLFFLFNLFQLFSEWCQLLELLANLIQIFVQLLLFVTKGEVGVGQCRNDVKLVLKKKLTSTSKFHTHYERKKYSSSLSSFKMGYLLTSCYWDTD